MQVGPTVSYPGAVSGPARCLTGLLVVGGYETINPDEFLFKKTSQNVPEKVIFDQCS